MIDRTARTDYPVHELISRRWSPVRFEDRPVEVEKLRQVFEAARWGSSCYNEQPWRFVVGVKGHSGVHEKIVSTLVDANRQWAQHAPVLAISVAKLAFDRNGKPNRHAQHDVGLAAGNLCVQATALGLAVHQMGGFDSQKARQVLGIPDGFEPMAAIAIGYAGGGDRLPAEVRARDAQPRQRLPLSSLVFDESWGEAASILAERSPRSMTMGHE